jgi:hypothetical protein
VDIPRRRSCARLAVAGLLGLSLMSWPFPAAAYRPFDGTDAVVVEKGEVEVELQPLGFLKDGTQKSALAPEVIINYGFAERWELVLQGLAQTPLSDSGLTNINGLGAFLRYVAREGSFQDKSGPSVAMEFGPLLPGIYADQGWGFSWSGIASQRWDWGAVHLNLMTNFTRDQRGELFLGVILEGPLKWTVRPVFEFFSDSLTDGTRTYSALAGAIWQVREDLSYDVAFRHAVTNSRPVNEIRAGVTFGFSAASIFGAGQHR